MYNASSTALLIGVHDFLKRSSRKMTEANLNGSGLNG